MKKIGNILISIGIWNFLITLNSAKLFNSCELAQELKANNIQSDHIATWVCIAYHQSNLNSSAVSYQSDGSGYHGLFQLSDTYWCSPPGSGWVCGLTCEQLRDDYIADDLKCIYHVYNEHQRLSGNGFNAWAAYPSFCKYNADSYTRDCSINNKTPQPSQPPQHHHHQSINSVSNQYSYSYSYKTVVQPKIYEKCELARELRFQHNIPMDQISTWVCIAKHESAFNTAAVGRLNYDGSGDHGLFQISDLFWCSTEYKGLACNVKCSEFEDNNITDDVKCIKQIHAEHTRISGNGFTAWTVYKPYCQWNTQHYIDGCFNDNDEDNTIIGSSIKPIIIKPSVEKSIKIYDACELAQELKVKHNMPVDQIATWVCIAKHESNFNTSAVGHLNYDGSGDHGLFQISDLYWCSLDTQAGKECKLSCSELEDNNISDDVECVKKIYNEHQRLSGNGFTAWTVYPLYCKHNALSYIENCLEQVTTHRPYPRPAVTAPTTTTTTQRTTTLRTTPRRTTTTTTTRKPVTTTKTTRKPVTTTTTTRKSVTTTTTRKPVTTTTTTRKYITTTPRIIAKTTKFNIFDLYLKKPTKTDIKPYYHSTTTATTKKPYFTTYVKTTKAPTNSYFQFIKNPSTTTTRRIQTTTTRTTKRPIQTTKAQFYTTSKSSIRSTTIKAIHNRNNFETTTKSAYLAHFDLWFNQLRH